MKKTLTVLFVLLTTYLTAQVRPIESLYRSPCQDTLSSYTGTSVGATGTLDYVGISITSEVQIKFALLSLQTNLNNFDPTFKARMGFVIGDKKSKLKLLLFMPMMNLSLKEFTYNTPFSTSFRYTPKILETDFLFELGTEIYTDRVYPFLTISVPFK